MSFHSHRLDSNTHILISMVFAALSIDPLLVWNYGTMAVLAGVAGVGFWMTFKDLDAEEDHLNELAAGGLHANI